MKKTQIKLGRPGVNNRGNGRPAQNTAGNDETKGSMMSDALKNSFIGNLLQSALGQGDSLVPKDGKQITLDDINSLALSYADTKDVAGDLAAIGGDGQFINITGRVCTFEPMLMMRLLEVHAPWKYQYTPTGYSFNSNGLYKEGTGDEAASISLAGLASLLPGLIGWVVVSEATDTMSGASSFTLAKSATAFSAQVKLNEITGEAVLVALNHSQDDVKTVSVAGAVAGDVLTATFSQSETNVPTQLFFDYSATEAWQVTGINSTLYIYPIMVTQKLVDTFFACITAGVPHLLPEVIAEQYRSYTNEN